MKPVNAAGSASKSSATKNVIANLAEAPGEIADAHVEQMLHAQAGLRAEKQRRVVGWEFREWLAAEQDWFPQ
jgi:hypothetical protein